MNKLLHFIKSLFSNTDTYVEVGEVLIHSIPAFNQEGTHTTRILGTFKDTGQIYNGCKLYIKRK